MPYSKMLSAKFPGCFVLLIDQSGSMTEGVGGDSTKQKAVECAFAVNQVLREIAVSSQKGDAFSPRCCVGLIGYGGDNVRSVFGGSLAGRELVLIDAIAPAPMRIATRRQKISDGTGGLAETDVPFPVWVEPAAGGGTPMAEALELATQWIAAWAKSHPASFPPVVINITDGEPNDWNDAGTAPATTVAAEALRAVATQDGNALLFNAHISNTPAKPLALPASEDTMPDAYARLLFSMSSVLADELRRAAESQGYDTALGSRGFVFNADADALVRLLTFGSNLGKNR
jgi:hypothetical protein